MKLVEEKQCVINAEHTIPKGKNRKRNIARAERKCIADIMSRIETLLINGSCLLMIGPVQFNNTGQKIVGGLTVAFMKQEKDELIQPQPPEQIKKKGQWEGE